MTFHGKLEYHTSTSSKRLELEGSSIPARPFLTVLECRLDEPFRLCTRTAPPARGMDLNPAPAMHTLAPGPPGVDQGCSLSSNESSRPDEPKQMALDTSEDAPAMGNIMT